MVNNLNNITEDEMLNEHTLNHYKNTCQRKMDEIFHELKFVKNIKNKKSNKNKTTKKKRK